MTVFKLVFIYLLIGCVSSIILARYSSENERSDASIQLILGANIFLWPPFLLLTFFYIIGNLLMKGCGKR